MHYGLYSTAKSLHSGSKFKRSFLGIFIFVGTNLPNYLCIEC